MEGPCSHEETTEPDDQGFVICLNCFTAIRRPKPLDDVLKQIKS